MPWRAIILVLPSLPTMQNVQGITTAAIIKYWKHALNASQHTSTMATKWQKKPCAPKVRDATSFSRRLKLSLQYIRIDRDCSEHPSLALLSNY